MYAYGWPLRVRNSFTRSVAAECVDPISTVSPSPARISSTRRRMNARMRISLNSASVWINPSICSRVSSMTVPDFRARARKSARRPEIMLTSPVNCPGAWMVTRVSPDRDGRTISTSPAVTTKNGTTASPLSTRISPSRMARTRP